MAGAADVVQRWVDACNEGDVDSALALCDPEIVIKEAEALPGAVTAQGVDEVRRYLERFATHWSQGRWEPMEVRENGDRVYMLARLRLVGRRSGIEVDRVWAYAFTVQGDKLLRQEGFDGEADGLAAVGLES